LTQALKGRNQGVRIISPFQGAPFLRACFQGLRRWLPYARLSGATAALVAYGRDAVAPELRIESI
jgi:hypothetical protein